jgi:hypothetical protein
MHFAIARHRVIGGRFAVAVAVAVAEIRRFDEQTSLLTKSSMHAEEKANK